ncbi:MAG: TMEM165/GDT1 family protein [Holophagales bacterium]|jgi:putative Ca2+/H+ antiporter (TMEM165/GDT1 family)|nr:TMEM165/GDT1 family protein [Holophagales bacterium]
MSKSIFWVTFVTVFLAEIGDKTQLAAMMATAKSGEIWTVFLSASLALILATFLGVLAGAWLFKYIPPHMIKYIAGFAFIGVGIWVLLF